jgi:2-keto-4-pentenoate hydratase/2-oxohepta-3-ene-1,7-dioic acid hydratase in catechol pathway
MRYCKYRSTESGRQYSRYALVELRDNALYAVAPMPPPEEDLAAQLAPPPQTPFQPAQLSSLQLLPPVSPSKILCVGRNYRDHAAELGNELPKEPLLFLKAPSSLLSPGGTIILPTIPNRIDYEGELALVIGRRCRNLGPDEDVRPYIRGYTIVNDISDRILQKSDGQWTRAKGFDTFCPVGPVVSDELDPCGFAATPPTPVTLTTRLNGEIKQHGSTADLIFTIPFLLRYISTNLTLLPGDLIPFGTPAGVSPLTPGDRIQVEIDGLGILENTVAAP